MFKVSKVRMKEISKEKKRNNLKKACLFIQARKQSTTERSE